MKFIEFEYSNKGGRKEDDDFDQMAGILQDIVIDPVFEGKLEDFLEDHCGLFEEGKEKNHEQNEVYKEFQDVIGGYIEEVKAIKNINFI